ncbi:DUF4294 domain-containing protein [Porphyromonas sp. COT-239 OH1446]|uniref:DUF4294 domain-containing protein n=1 Tax=Porphyromonas sp. COT-239 OH1446 TaxID=1515613 RepID=UPI00052CD33C|nr:DUF4294 domain-containing protein [Porphyromonas sp. COT-239 OH1446]KGN71453.1 hypothetical protein HQ37_03160 [Porphyromonas sp. COT-239 OH1446]
MISLEQTPRALLLFLGLLLGLGSLRAQEVGTDEPPVWGDELPELLIEAKSLPRPLNELEQYRLRRRIRDVRKTLPYARYIAATLIETYEYMETLPTEREQEQHLRRVQRELRRDMEPKMRGLTLRQGQLLIQLVYRQTGQTSYELVKAVLGGFKAWWWNAFANLMGASLKVGYDPQNNPNDATTERIIRLLELGML